MPLGEINPLRDVCASIGRDEVTAAQVDQDAGFIRASVDDVVDKALNPVFSKDRDFQEFFKTPQAAQLPSALPVRKAPNNGRTEGVDSWRGSHVFRAGGEGVIRLSISVGSPYGASHWQNFGTPHLIGNCPDTFAFRAMPPETQELTRETVSAQISGLAETSEIPNG